MFLTSSFGTYLRNPLSNLHVPTTCPTEQVQQQRLEEPTQQRHDFRRSRSDDVVQWNATNDYENVYDSSAYDPSEVKGDQGVSHWPALPNAVSNDEI